MIILGLTGSIGMGKTTVATCFSSEGLPVYSADNAVHDLYREEQFISEIRKYFPYAVDNFSIDRKKLSDFVFGNPQRLACLESVVHPKIRKKEIEFLQRVKQQGYPVAVLDIPLLFETGGKTRVDYTAVVSAPFEIQRKRVLERPGMTEKKFLDILSRQMPDEEKRKYANFVINTRKDIDIVYEDVRSVIRQLLSKEAVNHGVDS